jgi:ribonuclease D
MPVSRNKKQPLVVDDAKPFADLTKRLRKQPRIALDTEAASYHRYYDRIYLVQVSSEAETAVIDPLAVKDLAPIGEMLADPDVEIVFHDADYDLRVLDRDYGFHARNLFDTRVAAQLLGEPGVGLGALLEKYFDVQVDKKMQRADWSRRPLTDEMIHYAAGDTTFLLALRDTLAAKLEKAGRMAWAREEFARLEHLRWTTSNDGQSFLRVKGAKKLPPRSLAILRAVHQWRDGKAGELDRAPFRVLGNDAMITLAKAAPTTASALQRIRGVPDSAARRYSDELLAAVRQGLDTPEDKYPKVERGKRPKMTRATEAAFERLKSYRNRRARVVGIEAGVFCPNGTLQAIARAAPKTVDELEAIDELRDWQIEALDPEVLLKTLHEA